MMSQNALSWISMLEWRNWQTHGTQNPASFTGYEGSTPSSSTSSSMAQF